MPSNDSPLSINKCKISPELGKRSSDSRKPQKAWCENSAIQEILISEPLISYGGGNSLSKIEDGIRHLGSSNTGGRLEYFKNTSKHPEKLKKKKLCSTCPWRIPWIVLVNSLTQILFFTCANDETFRLLLYSPHHKKEYWRFITYAFLHSNEIHLVLNIFLQIVIAFTLETEQGHFRVLFVYLGGVICGSLGTSIFQPELLMVGSSAGVYSLLISHVPHLVMNFSTLSNRYFRIVAVIVICLSDVVFATYHCLLSGNTEPRISIAAHVCGAISGLLLGVTIYSTAKNVTHVIFKFASLLLFVICVILAVIVICKNIVIVI